MDPSPNRGVAHSLGLGYSLGLGLAIVLVLRFATPLYLCYGGGGVRVEQTEWYGRNDTVGNLK